MANVRFDKISAVKKVDLSPIQTAQTIRVNTREEVTKILTCSVESTVNNCECLQDEASVNGRTNVKILYLDQSGDVCSANCNADFSNTVQGAITPTSLMQATACVLESKSSFFGNVITVETLTEISSSVYDEEGVNAFVDGDVYIKRADKDVTKRVNFATLNTEIEQQLQTSKSIQRVLLADSVVCINDFVVNQDVATVEGKATVNLTYFSEGLQFETFTFDFSQEVIASSLLFDAQNSVSLDVKNTKIRLEVSEDEVNDTFTVEIVLGINVAQMLTETVSIIEDAYAKDCNLVLEKERFSTVLPCGNTRVDKKITATFPVEVQLQVLTTANRRVSVSMVEPLQGAVKVSGVFACEVLCKGQDDYLTVPVEVPFVETLAVDFVFDNCKATVNACVKGATAVVDASLRVEFDVEFYVVGQQIHQHLAITGVEETPIDLTTHAIEISIANKGETLWDLAKNLKMSEEEVLTINPQLTSPLEENTKVVSYNKV